ncbi:MAG: hypothetical protein DRN95_08035 [Candidatus Hydrothermarchaeota archaeon]|nr:MAG: hypothetical protein DRN95_08035 [Candidatus Hydrothermarchaeota archaeon]
MLEISLVKPKTLINIIISILKDRIFKKREDELSKELENILIEINEAYLKVSKFDECLPSYFKSIVENLVAYVARERKENMIKECKFVCEKIIDLMLDWRLINLYKAKQERKICRAKKIENKKYNIEDVEAKIKEIDELILNKVSELTVYPLVEILRISRELVERKNEESIFVAGVLLDYIEEMVTREEILERLRLSIL